jgi:hypothetical protein
MPPGAGYPGMPGEQPPYLPPQGSYPSYVNGNAASDQYQAFAPAYPTEHIPYYSNNPAAYQSYSNDFPAQLAVAPPMAAPAQALQPQLAMLNHQYVPCSVAPVPSGSQPMPSQFPAAMNSPRANSERTPQPVPRKRIPSATPISRKGSASVSRSPATTPSSAPRFDALAVLVCVAEDCFARAAAAAREVARRLDETGVHEYHKLVSTGLGCLDAALQSGRLAPRAEARIRLRYAALLVDETENLTEAETALTKGMALCEKVGRLPYTG